MQGKTKALIDRLMQIRSGGRSGTEHFVRAHLVLNGINPDEHGDFTPDDPETLRKLEDMIRQFDGKP
jgi:hypothetical protein